MSSGLTFASGLALLLIFAWYFATDGERAKRILGTVLTLLATAIAIVSFVPPKDKIQLGIDLRGGTSFLIRLKPSDTNPKPITKDALDKAMEVIRKRVDVGGTSEPVIAPSYPDRIMVQLPGVDPAKVEEYREALKKVAKLEFRMVAPNSDMILRNLNNPDFVLDPQYEVVPYVHERDGKQVTEQIVVSKHVDITGERVSEAHASISNSGKWDIALGFDSEGAEQFKNITAKMAQDQIHLGQHDMFAILVDKVVISAAGLTDDAVAAGGIRGGSAIITGSFTEKEARDVSSQLLNPLENPVSIEEERSTSATLGQDAIQSGLLAGYIGAGLTVLVTLLYYRFAGMVANIALAIFCALLFGCMGLFNAVLTLPGIAGILLTLGMAIDANVLIYERLREEQAAGKSLKAALDAAYDKASSAILDANVTTLITAALLFWKATGPVKGFAVSLVIGVVASMFTALIVTRNIFSWGLHWGVIKRISMVNLIPHTNIDFMGKRKAAITVSLAVIVGSIGAFVWLWPKNLGVDFRGGDRLVMTADAGEPPLDNIRKGLQEIGFADAVVQTEESAQGKFLVIRDRENSATPIADGLIKKFPAAKMRTVNHETVGGLVGKQLATNSIVALVLGMIGILIYVTLRFELSFAIGALVALLHDIIITVGVFSLLGRELSLVIVGAVLTIGGYSVNDTIVVYDRIREGIHSGRPGTIAQLMNASINEMLSRTILTGGVTLLTTISLFFFGGPVLNDFALTILIGVIVGTYSSVFIAAPIVLWWSGRGGGNLRSEVKKAGQQPAVTA